MVIAGAAFDFFAEVRALFVEVVGEGFQAHFTSDRFRWASRPAFTVSRFGGTVLIFLQPGIGSSDPRAMASPITQAQTALMRRLSRIIWRNENRQSVQFTCSMGGGSSRCFR